MTVHLTPVVYIPEDYALIRLELHLSTSLWAVPGQLRVGEVADIGSRGWAIQRVQRSGERGDEPSGLVVRQVRIHLAGENKVV